MNNAQPKTLGAIFTDPVPSTLEWRRIESLFKALGAQILEGRGSRITVVLNGELETFAVRISAKKPKPTKCASRGTSCGAQE